MYLDYFKTFLAVANKESFTKAAQHLYLSQTTVSFQIKALEEYYGAKLFSRSTTGVTLTEAGKILERHVSEVLKNDAEVKKTLASMKESNGGRLLIGASPTTGGYIMPILIDSFLKKHPVIYPETVVACGRDLDRLLFEDYLDIVIAEPCSFNKKFEYYTLAKEKLLLVVNPKIFLSDRKNSRVKMREILDLPFVFRGKSCCTYVTVCRALSAAGLSINDLRKVITIDDLQGLKTAVLKGVGVTIVSEWVVANEVSEGKLRAFEIEELSLVRDRAAIINKKRLPNNAIQALLNFLFSKETKALLSSPQSFGRI